MEARLTRAVLIAAAAFSSLGANHRTENFLVTASTRQLAVEIGQTAEHFRKQLAIEWLGKELPRWQQPCPIRATVNPQMGAGGATTFAFDTRGGHRGRPMFTIMEVFGPLDRVLDSVIPHEVLHTVFASYFGCPLPKWADEGACTTVEHASERRKQDHLLLSFLNHVPSRGIAFNRMFMMTEYPADMMPVYSQGYSLAQYLIAQGGKQKLVRYLVAGMGLNDPSVTQLVSYGQPESRQKVLARWTAATQKLYGFKDLSDLQLTWLDWVAGGSGPVQLRQADLLARVDETAAARKDDMLVDVAPRNSEQPATGSWYLRQRDHAKVAPSEHPAPPTANDIAVSRFQPGSIKRAPSVNQILSREQDARNNRTRFNGPNTFFR